MGRLASNADFFGGTIAGDAPLYSFYERFPHFATEAQALIARYGAGRKALVLGCGFGYLVDELVQLNVDAWGLDASTWAITQGKQRMPQIASRLFVGDATVAADVNVVWSAAGLRGQQKFYVAISDSFLECCSTDAEIQAVLVQMRRIAQFCFHILMCRPDDPVSFAGMSWKTQVEWRALINAPAEPCLDEAVSHRFGIAAGQF